MARANKTIIRVLRALLLLHIIVGALIPGRSVATPVSEVEAAHLEKASVSTRLTVSDAVHLLHRTGIGASLYEISALVGLTREEAVDTIITGINQHTVRPMPSWVQSVAPAYWARGDMTQEQRNQFNNERDQEIAQLQQWWVREMLETTSPQSERLILFWHNHFATAYSGVDRESTSMALQQKVFRKLGFGNYRMLLKSMLRDAALLNYLDNTANKKKSPNENLARELLELFTLGEGNYTELTVKEAARALTGWRVHSAANMVFGVQHWAHDQNDKALFGEVGPFDGDDLIDLILKQSAAATHLAERFWNAYVSDFYSDKNVIGKLADLFRGSDYQLSVLYRATLLSDAFWSQKYRGSIVKSPVALILGDIRSSGEVPTAWETLAPQIAMLGQTLFEPPNVAGWPGGGHWITPARLWNRQILLTQLSDHDQSLPGSVGNSAIGMMMDETMATMSTVASDDLKNQASSRDSVTVDVRVAAENYEGAPIIQIHIANRGKRIWSSDQQILRFGHDTTRFGRVSRTSMPWQTVSFMLPVTVSTQLSFDAHHTVAVEFLNDHAGMTGDRNVYVDWVMIDNLVFLAAAGKQKSRCVPKESRLSGNLYCEGTVTMSLDSVDSKSSKALVTESKQTSLSFKQAHTWWMNDPRGDPNWSQFSMGMTDAAIRGDNDTDHQRWDTLAIQLVSSRQYGLSLRLGADSCWPDCFDEWPACSWDLDSEYRDQSLLFPAIVPVDETVQCHWELLSEKGKHTVRTLISLLPQLIRDTADGRRARERSELHNLWIEMADKFSQTADVSWYGLSHHQPTFQRRKESNSSAPVTTLPTPKIPNSELESQVKALEKIKRLRKQYFSNETNVALPEVLTTVPPIEQLDINPSREAIRVDPVYQVM